MDKYYKYKHIFSCLETKDDVDIIRSKCPVNDYPIIDSIISSITFKQQLGFNATTNLIEKIIKMKYRNEIEKYLLDLNVTRQSGLGMLGSTLSSVTHDMIFDPIQQSIFDKIKTRKNYDVSYVHTLLIEKPCPHCGLIKKAPFGTSYVVCGVDSRGIISIDFDNGCLNDWCFECGKKLCKNWCKDALHNQTNRVHSIECCSAHANENGFTYPDDYCICKEGNHPYFDKF
jgi:hypothetical protein